MGKRILGLLGVDSAIFLTVAGRGWSVLFGPVTVWIIAHYLSPAEQGFYYTFSSIMAAKVFFELGLGMVLLSFASHEKAHLDWNSEGLFVGSPAALQRLASLLQKGLRFYFCAALGVFLVICPAGLHFLATGQSEISSGWRGPWFWLCLVAGLSLLHAPMLTFLEGCGLVAKIARVRLISAVAITLITCTALYCGAGLYAAPLAALANWLVELGWLVGVNRRVLLQVLRTHGQEQISWRREVWPMQWRIAISFVSGYFMYQMFNPLLFYYVGPAEAGRMGMSSNLVGAALTIGLAWINTKAAPMGHLIAQKKWRELDALFFRSMIQSVIVLIGVLGALLGCVLLLRALHHPLASRFLAPVPLLFLVLATIANHLLFAMGTYLRAHKRDPLLGLSVLSGVLITTGCWLLVQHGGVVGMMSFYVSVCWVVGVGYGSWIFRSCRKRWHTEP